MVIRVTQRTPRGGYPYLSHFYLFLINFMLHFLCYKYVGVSGFLYKIMFYFVSLYQFINIHNVYEYAILCMKYGYVLVIFVEDTLKDVRNNQI